MRRPLSLVFAAVLGGLFALGLIISGMTDPAKVIGFLDVAHGWDPTLAFVMAGGAGVYAILFRTILRRRSRPLLDVVFHLPTRRDLDGSLIAGAALFGIGWGLAGLCPGPGLVAAASGSLAGIGFVAAMLGGMYLQHRTARA